MFTSCYFFNKEPKDDPKTASLDRDRDRIITRIKINGKIKENKR